jgi:CheY-like chemotaxis protein
MDSSFESVDRRRTFRVNVHGLALLWHGERIAGRYSLADLSIGGCLLRDGPRCELGEEYGLVLDLPEEGDLRLTAKVVRQRNSDLGGRELGLQFLTPAAGLEDRIHDLVIQLLERERPPSRGRVLVVDMDAVRRTDAGESLRRLGHEVLEATTPLEAVWELENGPMDIHTVLVARSLGGSDGRDLLKFIGARYAGVWRVLVSDRSSDKGEPGSPADAVLLGPCHLSGLRKVLPRVARRRPSASSA